MSLLGYPEHLLRTRAWVLEKLKLHWSPKQIAGRPKIEAPEPVSYEYVYRLIHERNEAENFIGFYLATENENNASDRALIPMAPSFQSALIFENDLKSLTKDPV